MLFERKGYVQVKEFNWLKRLIALVTVATLLVVIDRFYDVAMWKFGILLFLVFVIVLWYGSQVKIESITIGLRYGISFLLLSFSLLFRSSEFNVFILLLSCLFLIISLFTSWSLPRVKLGLREIRSVRAIPLSITFVVLSYSLISYFLLSKELLSIMVSGTSIALTFVLLYSIYSRNNIIHFILSFFSFYLLFDYLIFNHFRWIEGIIILIIYLTFIVIQTNAKPPKKKGDRI